MENSQASMRLYLSANDVKKRVEEEEILVLAGKSRKKRGKMQFDGRLVPLLFAESFSHNEKELSLSEVWSS